MKVGAFELQEPVPDLREPYAFGILSPWIDVGRAGKSSLSLLESHFSTKELGKLRRPGLFYDFTRYRPTVRQIEDRREIKIPNTFITYARREQGNDLLFFHCLEPHMLGETYVDSILKVLAKLKVKRYCTLGAMYDSVPHTRPLIVSGAASETELQDKLIRLNINRGRYQGPTTINILMWEQAPKIAIETLSLIVHLPYYTQLEEDYSGQYSLLRLVCYLYNFSIDLSRIRRRGEEQYKRISLAIQENPQIQDMVRTMELSHDARSEAGAETDIMPPLSPEIERFLREIDKEFDSN